MIVLSRFCFLLLSCFHSERIVCFFAFSKFQLQNTVNRINPLLVIISSKLPAIINVIHKLLWVLQTIPNDN